MLIAAHEIGTEILDYESRGQEFESLRARHFGTKLGTPKPADFALEAAARPASFGHPETTTSVPAIDRQRANANAGLVEHHDRAAGQRWLQRRQVRQKQRELPRGCS